MTAHSIANITGPHGDNVCIYRITETGVEEISDDGVYTVFRDGFNDTIETESGSTVPLILKKCCPGFKVDDANTCIESRMGNPFEEGQFSYALIYLGILLIGVGLVSMFIAYYYHYRFQRNKKHEKHGLINNSFDENGVANSGEFQAVPMDEKK
uniref:CX domain-containing protein n=1 Tax=Panagrellus redivivus TaxID=6233 RepID=A0A7E4W4H9_PANRE